MNMTLKASVPGSRERRGGLNSVKGSSLRGLFVMALSGLFAVSALAQELTGPATVKPLGTPDADITRLNSKVAKFTWNRGDLTNGNLVSSQIDFGTLAAAADLGTSGVIPKVNDKGTYDFTVSDLPTDGRTVYVRLRWIEVMDGIQVNKAADYVYKAANTHYISSPTPGSALTLRDVDGCLAPPTATFDWEVVAALGQPSRWWFYLGTVADPDKFYNSGQLTPDTRSQTSTNIPTTGEPIIATLWFDSLEAGDQVTNWQSNIFTYTTPTLPAISSPSSGGKLPGTSGTLVLDPNGLDVQYWWVYAGSAAQQFQYHSQGQEVPAADRGTTASLESFQNFPDDGSAVFVTLFWRLTGEGPEKWKCREFTYTGSTGPVITAPIKGGDNRQKLPADLTSPTNNQLVTWDDKGTAAQQWQVVLNDTGTATDDGIWKSGLLGAAVREVSIPNSKFTTDGRQVYIVLRYWVGGGLAENLFSGSTYCAFETQKVPYLTGPGGIDKSYTLGLGNEVTFTWVSGNYPSVQGYWLYVGKTQGSREYHNTGAQGADALSATLTNLPTDGETIWVRLWWLVEETTNTSTTTDLDLDSSVDASETIQTTTRVWEKRDFAFTNPKCPEITSPGYGSTIVGTQRDTVIERYGVAVDGHWVTVSSQAPSGGDAKNPNPGTADIDNSNLLPADTAGFRVRNLPIDGEKVYVTLWWLKSNATVADWNFRTYAYTSSETVPVPKLRAPVGFFAASPAGDGTDANKIKTADYNFLWEINSTVAFGWWLYVADNQAAGKGGQPGGSNLHNSGFLQPGVQSQSVTGLPSGNVYVRLWYLDEFTQWLSLDYTLFNDTAAAGGGGGGGGGVSGPSGETDGNGNNNGL
jgi:hypothetical protein